MVINPLELIKEIEEFKTKGFAPAIRISARAHVIFPHHEKIDALKGGKIGTTGRGIGPTYSQKTERVSLRILDLIQEDARERISSAVKALESDLVTDGAFTRLPRAQAGNIYTNDVVSAQPVLGEVPGGRGQHLLAFTGNRVVWT